MEYSTPRQTLFRSNLIFLYFLFQIWNVEHTERQVPLYRANTARNFPTTQSEKCSAAVLVKKTPRDISVETSPRGISDAYLDIPPVRCTRSTAVPPWSCFHLPIRNIISAGLITTTVSWPPSGRNHRERGKNSGNDVLWMLYNVVPISGVWKKKRILLMLPCHARRVSTRHIKLSSRPAVHTSGNCWRWVRPAEEKYSDLNIKLFPQKCGPAVPRGNV